MAATIQSTDHDVVIQTEFGHHYARLCITGLKAAIYWYSEDGKELKTVPAAVRKHHTNALKAIVGKAKEIERNLTIQKERFDRFYLENRVFSYAYWQEKILGHSLMSIIAKRLIWVFKNPQQSYEAIWHKDGMMDVTEKQLPLLTSETEVRLWHPINHTVSEVVAWRTLLDEKKIRQPFKQAYREIYLITEAELNTQVYSNRFASHILKQHQFAALARLRGWKYTLLMGYDGSKREGEAKHLLSAWDLEIIYRVQALNMDDGYLDSGAYKYVSTSLMRFTRNGESVPLKEIPALIFSEMMRNIDLFVAVASIGHDPHWIDAGITPDYDEYWQSHSFGEMTPMANTRKEVIASLLPKLTIMSRCELDGRFLKVKGHLRQYKIHLGSSNILMEPNDAYLCIVPARRTTAIDQLFLPFEDDPMLSAILSKAFLLAEDDKITDETILSQIEQR